MKCSWGCQEEEGQGNDLYLKVVFHVLHCFRAPEHQEVKDRKKIQLYCSLLEKGNRTKIRVPQFHI